MNALFYLGFLLFVASTILFIVSILTRYWIQKGNVVRGIFEYCYNSNTDIELLSCRYTLMYSDDKNIRPGMCCLEKKHSLELTLLLIHLDYAVACSSLSIIAAGMGIMFTWLAGLYFCLVRSALGKKIIVSLMIAGTLLIGESFLCTFLNGYCCFFLLQIVSQLLFGLLC
jgi:hypothetical protein